MALREEPRQHQRRVLHEGRVLLLLLTSGRPCPCFRPPKFGTNPVSALDLFARCVSGLLMAAKAKGKEGRGRPWEVLKEDPWANGRNSTVHQTRVTVQTLRRPDNSCRASMVFAQRGKEGP